MGVGFEPGSPKGVVGNAGPGCPGNTGMELGIGLGEPPKGLPELGAGPPKFPWPKFGWAGGAIPGAGGRLGALPKPGIPDGKAWSPGRPPKLKAGGGWPKL